MKKIISYSNQEPPELDDFSSPMVCFLNKNVRKEAVPAYIVGGTDLTVYVHDQYIFTKEEYSMYLEDKDLTPEQRTAKIAELEAYLASTNWYSLRYAETGVKIPKNIKENRQKARVEISLLKDLE